MPLLIDSCTLTYIKMAQRALKEVYYKLNDTNAGNAAYLTNAQTLYTVTKRQYPALKRDDVNKFLKSSYVSSLYGKRRPRDRSYLKYALTNRNIAFACDLMFQNPNNSAYLTCVDPFSFKQMGVPIRNKEAKTVAVGMRRLVDEQNDGVFPTKIYTDSD